MDKKSKFKKLLSSALAGIITVSAITIPTLDVKANTSNIGAKNGDVVTLDTRGGDWLDWGVNDKVYRSKVDYGTYTNPAGGEYQNAVYCIEPKKPGVSTRGPYDVTLEEFDDDRIRAIFVSGYPVNTPTELGLSSNEQAFYATKMAIDTYLTGLNIDDWKPNTSANYAEYSTQVVSAIKKIYKDGMAYDLSSLPNYEYVVTFVKSEELGKQTYSKRFKVEINEDLKKNSASDVTVSLSGDVPSGAKLVDMSGNEKNTFAIGEEFQVVFTVPDGDYDDRGFDLNVVGGITNSTKLYKGVPADNSVQTYAVYPQWNEHKASYKVPYENSPFPTTESGKLTIYKYENGTTTPLQGAKFELKSLNGEISNIYTTNNSGQIVVDEIPDGNYVLKEVQAPKNYVIDYDFPLNIKIDSTAYPSGQEITIHNKKIPSVSISKVDGKTGKGLAGATIEIAYNGGNEKTTVTTDSNGKATFQPPYIGTYELKEIVAPSGYVLDETPQSVYVDGIENVVTTFVNYDEPTITITKHDLATSDRLPNAEFSITNKDTGEVIYEGVTDLKGEIVLTGLDVGQYVIKEIAPPQNYINENCSRTITVNAGKSYTVKFDNKLKPSLEITKVDGETNKSLPNATFKVEKEDGSFKSEFTTDSNGKILLQHIDEGVYTVTEIIAPNGYVLNTTPKTIDVKWQTNNTFVHSLVIENYTKPSLIVEKYDEMTNELLSNAQFRIEGVDNNFLWEGVLSKGDLSSGATQKISATLEDGRLVINGLEAGTYKITEINPPNGYTFSNTTENPRTVVIKENSTTTVKIDNRPLPDLEILKIDSVTKEPLKNATFEIRNTDGEFVAERQTDNEGKINLTNIPEGTYTISEKSAPKNYSLDSNNTKTIQIKWNGGDNKDGQYNLVFENTLKPTLVINKTSGLGGFGLSGAKFEVQFKQNDGGLKNLGTFITNSKGQIILPYVDEGWYVITEVKAPNGYQLPSNPSKEIYLSAGENSYSEIETPSTANDGNIAVSNGGNIKVTYGADIKEIASLFATTQSAVYSSSIDFDNYPLNSIVIKKTDALTGKLLDGATFELIKVAENVSGSQGTTIGTYTTDYTGVIVITGLTSGHYIVRETQAPINYDLNVKNQQQAYLSEDGTSIVELMFSNYVRP